MGYGTILTNNGSEGGLIRIVTPDSGDDGVYTGYVCYYYYSDKSLVVSPGDLWEITYQSGSVSNNDLTYSLTSTEPCTSASGTVSTDPNTPPTLNILPDQLGDYPLYNENSIPPGGLVLPYWVDPSWPDLVPESFNPVPVPPASGGYTVPSSAPLTGTVNCAIIYDENGEMIAVDFLS